MSRIEVVAGVLVRGGKILLTRRAPGERHAGFWEFPGGKREPGETAEESLVRELQEELGLSVAVGEEVARSRHRYEHGEIELRGFWVVPEEAEVRLTVHDRAEWVEPGRLLEYQLAAADVPIARKVAASWQGEGPLLPEGLPPGHVSC